MKSKILLAIASLTFAPFALAVPVQDVPDTGSTLGLFAVAALAALALRRKATK